LIRGGEGTNFSFHWQPKIPDEVIKPAQEGALNVLKAANSVGMKRGVLTSSLAAVSSNH